MTTVTAVTTPVGRSRFTEEGISEVLFQALRGMGWSCMLRIGVPPPEPAWYKNGLEATAEELQADIDYLLYSPDSQTGTTP